MEPRRRVRGPLHQPRTGWRADGDRLPAVVGTRLAQPGAASGAQDRRANGAVPALPGRRVAGTARRRTVPLFELRLWADAGHRGSGAVPRVREPHRSECAIAGAASGGLSGCHPRRSGADRPRNGRCRLGRLATEAAVATRSGRRRGRGIALSDGRHARTGSPGSKCHPRTGASRGACPRRNWIWSSSPGFEMRAVVAAARRRRVGRGHHDHPHSVFARSVATKQPRAGALAWGCFIFGSQRRWCGGAARCRITRTVCSSESRAGACGRRRRGGRASG